MLIAVHSILYIGRVYSELYLKWNHAKLRVTPFSETVFSTLSNLLRGDRYNKVLSGEK